MMVSPSRASRAAQPASANLTPQELIAAVNNDPNGVLQYIVGLETEVNRVQQHLVASREEMYTVIQISMSAVATEMSKTLNVTKNSLIGIQDKFHRIAASRSDFSGAVQPAVMRNYQGGAVNTQVPGDTKSSNPINFLGIGKEDQKPDFLTSDYSPEYGRHAGMSIPLNPTPKAPAHYTPTKSGQPPTTLLDLSRAQENAVFPSTTPTITPQFATTSSIFELSPTRSNAPFPRQFAVKPPMNANVKVTTPALSMRSDSQKNVQKTEAQNEAFLAFMATSHKNPRSYRSTPQPKPPVAESPPASPSTTHAELDEDGTPTVSTFVRPSGPLIKYDRGFLKQLRQVSRGQPNPFADNHDNELKPVLQWELGANKIPQSRRVPGTRISSLNGPPGGAPHLPVAPNLPVATSTWF